GFDAAVRIYNPDGSEAEKSGNGTRIFAKFCMDHGYATSDKELKLHTLGGPVSATLDGRRDVRVDRAAAHRRRSHVLDDELVGGQSALRALRRALRRGVGAKVRA